MANAGEVEFELLIFIFFIFSWRNLVAATTIQDHSGIIPYAGSNDISEHTVVGIPVVKEVSAMCSNTGGIHASVEFDRPFSGRIYSLGFGNVHECVYFNGFYTKSVLFSIPVDNCGTRLTRNTREVVDMFENRVYVQTDKYTLTSFDRKFAFVCELSAPNSALSQPRNSEIREIRRRPISPVNLATEMTPKDDDKDIQSVTAMTPIIPRNAPKGAKPMMPAMLYYGQHQWNIPPENINFKSVRLKANGKSEQEIVEHPTVIVPIEDRTGEILNPFRPDVEENEKKWNRVTTENPERELHWNRVSRIQDADLLDNTFSAPPNSREFPDNLFTKISTTTFMPPKSTSIQQQFAEKISIVPLFESTTTTANFGSNPTTPLIVLPFAKQKNLNPVGDSIGPLETRTFIAGSTSSNDVDKSIYLEIKRGAENLVNSSRIDGTVRIGEPIMLVVHAKSTSTDPSKYNIFVHSCYSSGGSDLTRIQLIDSAGCSVHPQVIGGMKRERFSFPPPTKSNDTPKSDVSDETQFNSEVVYYFAMRAFKFPTGDDVHFFCSVDISQDYNFPELCPSATSGPRRTRWASANTRNGNSEEIVSEPPAMYKDGETMAESFSEFDGGKVNLLGINDRISSVEREQNTHIHGVKVSNVTFVADDSVDLARYERITGNVVVSENGVVGGLSSANVAVLTATAVVALMILVASAILAYQLIGHFRQDADLSKGFVRRRRHFSSTNH